MLKHAVILAAGVGKRLGVLGATLPKGALEVSDTTLVERSVRLLIESNISEITIVTGFAREWYHAIAAKSPEVNLVHNENYESSGSMHSLYLALRNVAADFLLLESDIIYEQKALAKLLATPDESSVLISGFTGLGDEVWIRSDQVGLISSISKNSKAGTGALVGELVGISKLSSNIRERMISLYTSNQKLGFVQDYDQFGLNKIAQVMPLPYVLVSDLIWGEIDDEEQYRLVTERIVPRIFASEHSPDQ